MKDYLKLEVTEYMRYTGQIIVKSTYEAEIFFSNMTVLASLGDKAQN